MQNNSSNSQRIAKNSVLLYARMVVVMVVNLYAVRLILQALGSVDYGINDVVAGVITMLISMSSVFSAATQRYYSISIGENNLERLRNIFSTSINIYILLSLVVLIFGETIGLWFINTQLVIPEERMAAANWIYQFSLFSCISTFIQLPYSAAILAHEDIGVFAFVSTAESAFKLLAAYFIFAVPQDRLITYGATLLLLSILVMTTYVWVGYSKYEECRYQRPTEKALFKELLSYSQWSLIGSVAGIGMNQVITILVNIYFGPLVNTARAMSFQFNIAIGSFCGSFLMAIRPQMMKSYAEGSFNYLNQIFYLSNKILYYGLLMLCLPIMFEMNTILSYWLKTTDPQTVLFSRLIILYALLMSLNNPISIIIQAMGRLKDYHVPVEAITLLCVPVTFILFKLGYPAFTAYIVLIITTILAHFVRLISLKKFYTSFSFNKYFNSFVLPACVITFLACLFIFIFHINIENPIMRLSAVVVASVVSITVLTIIMGLSKEEKEYLKKSILYLKIK